MLTLSSTGQALLASGRCVLFSLIHMSLSSAVRINTSPWNLSWGGYTWTGDKAGVCSVDELGGDEGEVRPVRFSISGALLEYVSVARGESIRGKAVTIRTGIADLNLNISDVFIEWAGKLDVMEIEQTGETVYVTATAEHNGVDLLRPSYLLYSDEQQQIDYPGDRGYEYVKKQEEVEIVWPAKTYYTRKK